MARWRRLCLVARKGICSSRSGRAAERRISAVRTGGVLAAAAVSGPGQQRQQRAVTVAAAVAAAGKD